MNTGERNRCIALLTTALKDDGPMNLREAEQLVRSFGFKTTDAYDSLCVMYERGLVEWDDRLRWVLR